MKIATRPLLVVAILASLVGCSYFQFPGVHKIYVQQGHVLKQDMIDELEVGMTKSQVRYVLGTPLLADAFNQDRWDYYYSLRLGDETLRQRAMTVYFENDKMTHFTGDVEPSSDDEEDLPAVPTNTEEGEIILPEDSDIEGTLPVPTNT